MVKYIAIIPLKKISKGLPEKNYRQFYGKPMYQWALDACLECERIEDVYITSSWQQFRDEMGLNNDKVRWIDRPSDLDGNTELLEVMQHASRIIHDSNAIYIQVQPNKPLIKKADLDWFILEYESFYCNTLFQVQEIKTSLDWEYQPNRQARKKHFKSCSLAKMWDYGTLRNAKKGTWGFGEIHRDIIVPDYHIEIDNEMDFRMAEALKKAGF